MHSRDINSGNHNPLNRETYFFVPPSVTSGETVGCFASYCRKGQGSRGLLLRSIRILESSQKAVNSEIVQEVPTFVESHTQLEGGLFVESNYCNKEPMIERNITHLNLVKQIVC